MPKITVKRVDITSAILTGCAFSIVAFVFFYLISFVVAVNTDVLSNNQHYFEFTDIRLFFLKMFLTGILVFAFLGSLASAVFAFCYNFFSSHITSIKIDIEEVEKRF